MRGRRTLRGSFCIGLLLGVACGETPTPRPPEPSASTPPSPASAAPGSTATASTTAQPSAPDPALLERLAREAVFHNSIGRVVLYTWTTAEQAAELARTRRLLTRTESPEKGRSFFDRRRDQTSSPESRLFDEPALAKRRFAWTNPWATLRGWQGESYGDRLIRVTLKPEAIIAMFTPDDPSGLQWRFFTSAGAPMHLAEVVRNVGRIAAVYHVFDGIKDGDQKAPPFREYVLCNESMIDSWEIGTERIAGEIADEIAHLRRLRAELDRAPPERRAGSWPAFVARDVWPSRREGAEPARLYEASLAFANDRYELVAPVVDDVIKALAAVPRGDPIEHRPDVAFAGFDPAFQGGLPTSASSGRGQAVKCFPQGTFGCFPLSPRAAPGTLAPPAPKPPPPLKPAPGVKRADGCVLRGTFVVCPPGKKP